MKRSRGFGMGEVQRVKEDEEVVWEEREVGILESVSAQGFLFYFALVRLT